LLPSRDSQQSSKLGHWIRAVRAAGELGGQIKTAVFQKSR
jgi:hypothetical protein